MNMETQHSKIYGTQQKAVLRGNFIVIQAYLKKQEKSQINNLTLHLKELEKEEKTKPKVSRWKEIIKVWAEINEIEIKKTIEKIIETKSCSRRKINKIAKLLTRLTKRKRERAQINKIRNEKEVTMDTTEMQRIIRDYKSNYMSIKWTTWKKWKKFSERYSFPKLNQEEIENMNRPITSTEIETVV